LALARSEGVRIAQLVDDLDIPGDGPRAEATLRTYATKLRRLLGPCADRLIGGGGRLRLALHDDELDVGLFERHLAAGDLSSALALWRGAPFVSLLDHDWARVESQRLARLRIDAWYQVNEQRLIAGDPSAALADLERLVVDEPFHEGFHAQYVQALYSSGRPAQALAAQRAAVQTLVEVGLQPGPDLVRLEHDVLTHSSRLTGVRDRARVNLDGFQRTVPPALRRRRDEPAFVGRNGELSTLVDALGQSRVDGPGVVVVRGEPGIGKTRLAAEAARAAAATGSAVLYGRCERAADLPFGPLFEMFGSGLDVPSGADARPESPSPPNIDDALARRLLMERCAAVCAELGDEHPLLIVLDDAHWATASTMAAVTNILELVGEAPVLLLLTMRTVDPAPDGSVGIDDLRRRLPLQVIDLDGLGLGEVDSLLDAETNAELSAEEVLDATGGNPYFVTELARSGRHDVPASVLDVLSGRLDRISPLARELARTAALSGLEFSLSEVAAAIEAEPASAVAAADELISIGLVDDATTPGRLRFPHALARIAVDSRTTSIRRAHASQRLAEVLEQLHDPPAERIAHHWERAGPEHRGRAASWLARAGHHALAGYAWEAAVVLLDRAVELADGTSAPWLVPATLDLAAAHVWLGDAVAARSAIHDAADRARQAGDVEVFSAAVLWGTTGGRGSSLWHADGERVRLLQEAYAWLEDADGPTLLRVRVAGQLALALFRVEEREQRQTIADAALQLADADGSTPVLAAALAASRVRFWHPSDRGRRSRYLDAALGHASETDDPQMLADALDAERTDAHEAGDRERFDAAGRRLVALAAQHGGAHLRWRAAVIVAHDALLDDRLADVPTLAESGLAVWGSDAAPDAVIAYGAQLALAALLGGRPADALALIEAVSGGDELLIVEAALAFGQAATGRRDLASATIAGILADDARRLPQDSGHLIAVALVAEAISLMGDRSAAAAMLPLVEPWVSSFPVMVGPGISWAPLAHAAGSIARVLGDLAAADAWFEQAERDARRFGAVGFARRTALARSGAPSAAR
jgi:DNA-binding SARP family transcriptional activator/tetratricopeptide (TPR) repeat protein